MYILHLFSLQQVSSKPRNIHSGIEHFISLVICVIPREMEIQ